MWGNSMAHIKLQIPEELSCIAGNSFGREICENQVLPKLIKGEEVVIEMPEHVRAVAIGFMQGMKYVLLKFDIDIKVSFKASTQKLEEKMFRDYHY